MSYELTEYSHLFLDFFQDLVLVLKDIAEACSVNQGS